MQTTCSTRRGGTASSGAVRALCVAALAAAVAASGGCGSRRSAPSESAPSAPVQAPAPAPAQAPGAPPSSATNLDDYKREVALHIHRLAASQVFEGRPPSLLRSVIVASLLVDGSGNLAGVRILRDNGDAETVAAVRESMRRAAPFPRPPRRLLRSGRIEFSETWLVRDDAKFQLRTLADAWQQ